MKTNIIQNPDPVLRKKSKRVTNFKDKNLHKLIDNMRNVLYQEDGLGLAAPQINISKAIFIINPEYAPRIRILGMPLSILRPKMLDVYINPQITLHSKEKDILEEGCLSIHGFYHPIVRPKKVTIKAQTEKGKKFKVKADGLLAKIFQHETDHLNGLLIIDRLHESR